MLLGVYGMYSTGKTTFMSKIKDYLADVCIHDNLIIVLADLAMEYWYDPDQDIWISHYDKPTYKGKQIDKLAHADEMVADRSALWIVESARYFGGMHQHLASSVKHHGGGLKFIVPVCTIATGKRFLMDRCAKRNKTFRADYWTAERLGYECMDRYTNPMKNVYEPIRVWYSAKLIDYKRTAWEDIGNIMLRIVAEPASSWYLDSISPQDRRKMIEGEWTQPDEDLPDKGHERQRQDNYSQAAVRRVPRY